MHIHCTSVCDSKQTELKHHSRVNDFDYHLSISPVYEQRQAVKDSPILRVLIGQ